MIMEVEMGKVVGVKGMREKSGGKDLLLTRIAGL